jgi:hypothetical protein
MVRAAHVAIAGLKPAQVTMTDNHDNHSIGQLAYHLPFWDTRALREFSASLYETSLLLRSSEGEEARLLWHLNQQLMFRANWNSYGRFESLPPDEHPVVRRWILLRSEISGRQLPYDYHNEGFNSLLSKLFCRCCHKIGDGSNQEVLASQYGTQSSAG